MDSTQALAAAWASIDGKLKEFHTDADRRDGYLADAADLKRRLERRGWMIISTVEYYELTERPADA